MFDVPHLLWDPPWPVRGLHTQNCLCPLIVPPCLTNIHMKEYFFCVVFEIKIDQQKNWKKKFWTKKKKNCWNVSKTLNNIVHLKVHFVVKDSIMNPSRFTDMASPEFYRVLHLGKNPYNLFKRLNSFRIPSNFVKMFIWRYVFPLMCSKPVYPIIFDYFSNIFT